MNNLVSVNRSKGRRHRGAFNVEEKTKNRIKSYRTLGYEYPAESLRDKAVRIRMCMRCNARRKNDFYVTSAVRAKPRRLRSFFCFHLSPYI